jgi:hypothetical protein
MKKSIIAVALLFSFATVNAQNNPKINEIGLTYKNLGLIYQWGHEHFVYRISGFGFNAGDSYNKPSDTVNQSTDNKSFSLGCTFGVLQYKPLKKNTDFYYGLDLIESFNINNNQYNNGSTIVNYQNLRFTSGIGAVLGMRCKVYNNFSVGGELEPTLSYYYQKNGNSTGHGFSIDGNIGYVKLILTYRL